MTVHLTDDEVAAACGLLGLAWPYPLPTVEAGEDELAAASRRGVRSLTVRALIGVDTESGSPGLDAEIVSAVTTVVNGEPVLVSGLIGAEGALRSSGSAAYVVQSEDGTALFTTVTATGIHVLAPSSLEDAREAFISLVDNAQSAGVGGSDGSRLLVIQAGRGERSLAVGQGEVTRGEVSEQGEFRPTNDAEPAWSRDALADHLRAS